MPAPVRLRPQLRFGFNSPSLNFSLTPPSVRVNISKAAVGPTKNRISWLLKFIQCAGDFNGFSIVRHFTNDSIWVIFMWYLL